MKLQWNFRKKKLKKNNKKADSNDPKKGANASFLGSTKQIERKCIGCNKIFGRDKLIRILKCHKTKAIIINPDSKQFGRSAYLCPNKECLKIALKKKKLLKLFKTEIPDYVIKELENIIN